MTRSTSGDSAIPRFKGEDDDWYSAVVLRPKGGFIKKGNAEAEIDWQRKDGLQVEFEVSGHDDHAGDLMGFGLGLQSATKEPSRLRQLLNALVGQERDAEVWFDDETLEFGHDLAPDAPAEAKLVEGMIVRFKGINRKDGNGQKKYRITGYKSAAKK